MEKCAHNTKSTKLYLKIIVVFNELMNYYNQWDINFKFTHYRR